MTIEPMLEGERIARSFYHDYPRIAKQLRKGPVDFSIIPKLKQLVEEVSHDDRLPRYPDIVLDHLADAANEKLPLEAREQHFDIAGAIVWNCFKDYKHTEKIVPSYIHLFQEANGV